MRFFAEPTPSSESPHPHRSCILWQNRKFLPWRQRTISNLSDVLEKEYDNYHFEEEIQENDVVFDYKLRTGRAMTRNAIRLLAMIGYDPKIIEAAQESAKHFEETGVWK